MKLKTTSKTLIITLALILLCIISIIFTSIRSTQQRIEAIPTLPGTLTPSTEKEPNSNSSDYSKIAITPENVIQVIAQLERPEQYHYVIDSELFSEKSSAKYRHKVWNRGNLQRIDMLYSNGTVKLHTLYSNDTVYTWAPQSGSYYASGLANISTDESQMLMSYEDVLKLTSKEILSAEFTTYENQGCIHLIAQPSDSNSCIEYWISAEHGLLLAGQAMENDFVFYSAKISNLNLSEQDASVFRLPDGKQLSNS